MTKNKKKLIQFGVGALLSISLIFGVIIHEIVCEGNQRKLFFPFLQERGERIAKAEQLELL